jgi:glutamine amidotransferase
VTLRANPRATGTAGGLRLAILDYGMGNLRSVEKALEHVGAVAERTSDHERIRAADGVVLPGVGAFPKAMEAVRRLELDSLLRELVGAGRPVLGICLGVQLLFERSTELGGAEGIGLLEGGVEVLEADGLKLPQIGWNPVAWRREDPLTAGVPNPCAFYHVHTFAPRPARDEDILGTAGYGGEFVTAVARPPVWGVQFHPEKSGPDGLRLLGNFARSCVPVAA